MKTAPGIHLQDVQAVYSGPERKLWELLMGEQIHLGGLQSSTELAERANIGQGQTGVDLCCASGAGMRFLVRFRQVARMTGVDATPAMLRLGRERCAAEGLSDRVEFVEGDVRATGLPPAQFDFAWGEDAWCYVEDKAGLVAEACRLVKPGGKIAFTDWMEAAESPMNEKEADRYLRFMKFPSVLTLEDYARLLQQNGCRVTVAQDTGRFPDSVALYLNMIEHQLTYDALKIIDFNYAQAQSLIAEMRFLHSLAKASKIIQGLVVAEKTR